MALETLFSRQGHRVTSVLVFLFFASLLSTKNGYSYVLSVLALHSFWLLAQQPRLQLERSEAWIVIWMVGVALLGIVAAAWHGDPADAYEVPAKFVLGIVLLLACIKQPPQARAIWLGLAAGTISGLAVAYWKMHQIGVYKAFGFTGAIQFGNLSLTMGVILVVALCWTLRYPCDNRRFWLGILAAGVTCGLMGSYFSGTRGGWVAIPVFLMLFLLSYMRRGNFLSCVLASIAIIASGAIVTLYSPMLQERIQQVSHDLSEYQDEGVNSSSSLGARFAIWHASIDLLKEKPILGWGEVRFRQELHERADEGLLGQVPANLANTHNTFLEVWVMYGGLALIALIGFLISSAWHFLSYLRDPDAIVRVYALAGVCLVLGYVVYSQSQIMLIRNNTLMFFLLMLATLMGLLRQRKRNMLTKSAATALC